MEKNREQRAAVAAYASAGQGSQKERPVKLTGIRDSSIRK